MTTKIELDMTRLRAMFAEGLPQEAMARTMQCSQGVVYRHLKEAGLRRRAYVPPRPKPTHLAAVTMPADPVRSREDWPEIEAAIARAKGSSVAMGQVAARFRLPYATVKGLAGR